jgi:16S rRNA (guanine966-N2)-methyltransferase
VNALRVIAGSARGRRLQDVPGELTRPITDRAKESLFDILGGDIEDATFLDLFAGTGSVGIEALSRGARFARFIDSQRLAIDTIRHNLQVTGLTQKAEAIRMDAFNYLERSADILYAYVFIAPPQYKGVWKRAILALDQYAGWLAEDAWVIAQIHPVEYESLNLEHLFEFEKRQYGSVLIVFYQMSSDIDLDHNTNCD